jgi:glycosyltransferase involved in cell wall biosynthesis
MNKVDIFIPCFNSASTLCETLDSLLNQSFKDFRVLLVDNCSTDDSVEIFKKIKDSRFSVKIHNEHLNLGGNLNRCISYVDAKYFCIMHADDVYDKSYLSEMINFLEINHDISLLHCSANIINKNSLKIFSLKNHFKNFISQKDQLHYSGNIGLLWISKFNKIMAPSVIYRSANFCNKLTFDPSLKFTLDWDFYFRSLIGGVKICKLNVPLLNYRIHPDQQTSKLTLSMEKYQEVVNLLVKMKKHLNTPKKSLNNHIFFIFFYLTMISDATKDFFSLNFANSLNKINFLFNVIKNNQLKKL